MSDEFFFDVSLYTRPPQLNVASAVGVGSALLAAVPKHAPAAVIKAAKRLRVSVLTLQTAWAEADAVATPEDPRPADHAVDNAWGNLFARLDAYANLPADRFQRTARAGELRAALFVDGLGFLKLPYAEEWAESKKRIDRIEREHLEKDLAALAGEEFLADVKHAHAKYGEAIGVTKTKSAPAADPARLDAPLKAAARAMTFYATQVAATVDPEEPDTARLAQAALKPIDDLRAAQSGRRGTKGAPAEVSPGTASPTSPVPDVPKA